MFTKTFTKTFTKIFTKMFTKNAYEKTATFSLFFLALVCIGPTCFVCLWEYHLQEVEMRAKATKMDSKTSRREQNGTRRVPKVNQNASKDWRLDETWKHIGFEGARDAQEVRPMGVPPTIFGTILGAFFIKNALKNDAKTDVEKACEIMRKCFQNDTNTRSKIHDKTLNF